MSRNKYQRRRGLRPSTTAASAVHTGLIQGPVTHSRSSTDLSREVARWSKNRTTQAWRTSTSLFMNTSNEQHHNNSLPTSHTHQQERRDTRWMGRRTTSLTGSNPPHSAWTWLQSINSQYEHAKHIKNKYAEVPHNSASNSINIYVERVGAWKEVWSKIKQGQRPLHLVKQGNASIFCSAW